MMNSCYCVLLLLISSVHVLNSMSLNGPVLTRYDPCGLGVIYFDRVKLNFWKGAFEFGAYPNDGPINAKINFAVPVYIYEPKNQTFEVSRTTHYDFIVNHKAPVPSVYVFEVEVNGYETNVPIVSKFMMNGKVLCDDDVKAVLSAPYYVNVSTENSAVPTAYLCGRRSVRHTELVSTRTVAQAGDWPWHVAILISDALKSVAFYHCGGSIISRTAVLTAGHCVLNNSVLYEPHFINVVAGTNNYSDITQIGRQSLYANQVILHPAYRDDTSTSDLAIIRVNKFIFTEYVQPICVWGPTYDKKSIIGKEATIVGFGAIENDQLIQVLRSSNTLVQDDSKCINFKPTIYTKLMDEFSLCVGFGPNYITNPRNGDSGGGLVVKTVQADHMITWMLRGVLSKCGTAPNQTRCDPTYYVVYTDVAPHYGWINHHSGLMFQINV